MMGFLSSETADLASEYESRISACIILINLVITVNIFASQFFLNMSILTCLTFDS